MAEQASLGELLRHARRKHGVTQKQIATICEVSETAVHDWENDDTVPALEHLPKLVKLLPSLSEADLAIRRSEVFLARALARAQEARDELAETRARYKLPG